MPQSNIYRLKIQGQLLSQLQIEVASSPSLQEYPCPNQCTSTKLLFGDIRSPKMRDWFVPMILQSLGIGVTHYPNHCTYAESADPVLPVFSIVPPTSVQCNVCICVCICVKCYICVCNMLCVTCYVQYVISNI